MNVISCFSKTHISKTIFLVFILFGSFLGKSQYWTRVSQHVIDELKVDKTGYWGLLSNGIVHIDKNDVRQEYISTSLTSNRTFKSYVKTSSNKFYLLDSGNGIHEFDFDKNKWKSYYLITNWGNKLLIDKQETIWSLGYTQSQIIYKSKTDNSFKWLSLPRRFSNAQFILGSAQKGVLALAGDSLYNISKHGIISKSYVGTPTSNFAGDSATYFYVHNREKSFFQSNDEVVHFFPVGQNQHYYHFKYDIAKNQWVKTKTPIKPFINSFSLVPNTSQNLILSKSIHNTNPGDRQFMGLYEVDSGFKTFSQYHGVGTGSILSSYSTEDYLYLSTERGVFRAELPVSLFPSTQRLHSNRFSGEFNSTGALFYDNNLEYYTRVAQADTINHAFNKARVYYGGRIWIVGKNRANGVFHGACSFYENGDDYDEFYNGPVSLNYDLYRKPWIAGISKQEIDYHKKNYQKTSYRMPHGIKEWPAHGFVNLGQAMCLAPFVDVDANGIYEPQHGDYPKIRGDQAVYVIYNDAEIVRDSGRENFGAEVHAMYYRFDNHPDPHIQKSIFAHLEIINRSMNDYDSVHVGIFTDFDLGCSQDDFIGCRPNSNTFFAYNGDPFDEDCRSSGGFGKNTPISCVTTLSDSLTGFSWFDFHWSHTSGPSVNRETFYRLTGRWRDGSYLRHGGGGHISNGGGKVSPFHYPGKYDTLPEWSEVTIQNTPADRRGFGSMGSYNLSSDSILKLDFVFHLVGDSNQAGKLDSVETMANRIATFFTQQSFQNFEYKCSGTPKNLLVKDPTSDMKTMSVFPNPTKNFITIKNTSENSYNFKLYNLQGNEVAPEVFIPVGKKELDVSHLSSGVYIGVFHSKDNIETQRIVIKH